MSGASTSQRSSKAAGSRHSASRSRHSAGRSCRSIAGTSYNIGRMAGAIAPFVIGAVATIPGVGIGLALGVTSAFFLLAAGLVFTLPDRSGQALD